MDDNVTVMARLENRRHGIFRSTGENFDLDNSPVGIGLTEDKDFVTIGLADCVTELINTVGGEIIQHGERL